MPNPSELLALARHLSTATATFTPNDAELRRAVSTAYYALFHNVVAAAAERFMGPGYQNSAGYGIIYRGFEHREIKNICEALEASTLKEKYKKALKRTSLSKEIKYFARMFPFIQEQRHGADYDPHVRLFASDVVTLVNATEAAMGAFDRAAADEKADILALMMVGARG
jgi:uncharacterized protein (UPF0332 family)